MNNKIIFLK